MKDKILLYFSDTGRGHRSATEAIEEALYLVACIEGKHNELEVIKEASAEKSHPINRAFVEFYNHLLRHQQELMRYYYSFLNFTRPNESKLGYLLVKKFLLKQLMSVQPSVVVSVHPMTNHFVARSMQESGLLGDIKFLEVVTDPNASLWPGWACPQADLIMVPNSIVKEKLLEWGIKEERIKVVGMPIHPDFLKPPSVSRTEFLTSCGLSCDLPTLCINAGWAGGGNMLAAYESLSQTNNYLQIIFLCGHNRNLYDEARRASLSSKLPTTVLPFHDNMPDLMSACDAMVTKAGGLTTFECIAKRLPMIIDVIKDPMPQEQGTVDILVEQGLAQSLRNPQDLAAIVKNIKHDPLKMNNPLPSAYCLNKTNAVFEIAKTILEASSTGRFSAEPALERKIR